MANITEQIKSLYGQIKCLRDDVAACCGILSTGLERLDEGLGDTWRLVDKDPTLYYGGFNAIDFGLNTIVPLLPSGESSFNIGYDNKPIGFGAFATGQENEITGAFGVSFGEFNKANGYSSYTHGYLNQALSVYSRAYGQENIVTNWFGYAEGSGNQVDGEHARAYGLMGKSLGYGSVTDGYLNEALHTFSVAKGYRNIARGYGSYAQGMWNDVNSLRGAYAFGDSNKTIAENSFLSGIALDAGDSFGVAIFGTANEIFVGSGSGNRYNENDPIFIVGNGTYSAPETNPWEAIVRSNALFLDKGGRMFLPSVTNAKIDAASGDVVVTKSWATGSINTSIYDAVYDTEAEILALDEVLHQDKTYWAKDTKSAYRSVNNVQLALWYWQKLTVEYDMGTDTFKLPTTYLGQTQDLGQELFFLGVNNSTINVTELEPKLFLGLSRDALYTKRLSCSLAKASDIKNGDVYGVSTTASVIGQPMVVTTYGEVKDVKTDQWAVNSVLYASSVAGELTDIRPETNARIIAEVLVSHATEGVLSINTVQNLSLEKESSVYTSRVVYLTGEPDGVNYFASESEGSVPTVTAEVSVPNNTTVSLPIYHTGDSPQLIDRTIVKGERTATLSYAVNSIQGQEKFYIEAYLVDDLGALVAAATGLPVGSLGVVPIGVLESPILNTITANQENTIELRGQVPVDVVLPTDYTVRYQIRCEKIGATGGDKTFTLYFGSDHDSKVIGLGILTTDTVQNTSSVVGATTTEALNTLDNKFGEYVTLNTTQIITEKKKFNKLTTARLEAGETVAFDLEWGGGVRVPENGGTLLVASDTKVFLHNGNISTNSPRTILGITTEDIMSESGREIPKGYLLLGKNQNEIWLIAQSKAEGASQINSRLQVGFDQFLPDQSNQFTLAVNGTGFYSENVSAATPPTLDEHLANKLYVDEKAGVSQKNLSYGESYIQNYRSRVLDDGATYFSNEGGYDYALLREQGLDQDVSLMLTPSAVKTGVLYNVKPKATLNDTDFTVVRGSTATYTDEDGIIQTAEINVPRVNYIEGKPSIKVEPQSTNLLLWSEGFGNAVWLKASTVITSNLITAPDGNLSADLLQGDGVNAFASLDQPVSGTGTYTFSTFVKKELSDTVIIRMQGASINGGGAESTYRFNFLTEIFEIRSGEVAVDFGVEKLPNGWYQIFIVNSVVNISLVKVYAEYGGTASTKGTYIWGAQLEEGIVTSSYIPTQAATVTRLADVITLDTSLIIPALTSIVETIEGVEQPPIVVIPPIYQLPEGNINKVIGLSN